MPRYFFHVYNDEISLDDEGQELPDLEAARGHAIMAARSLMRDGLAAGSIDLSHFIAIDDEKGEQLFELIELLEELDDVQNVYANFEVSDALVSKMSAA